MPPPHDLRGIVRHLGPGLIIAASIVGSGELIATTLTGARSGLVLLWLILLGCVVKVFAQIEIGRFTIATGIPPLSALNLLPGPRLGRGANWLVWYWFVMWGCSIGQLGGIVGGVGQVLALVHPLTEQGVAYQRLGAVEARHRLASITGRAAGIGPGADTPVDGVPEATPEVPLPDADQAVLERARADSLRRYGSAGAMAGGPLPRPLDDRLWAIPVAVVTAALLLSGGYGLIQTAATAMVAIFTLVTLAAVCGMQATPAWSIPTRDWIGGLSFGLPAGDRRAALATALATVGVIGVGAAELLQYPYWCLEKGYARFTGPDDGTAAWRERARGWIRVMTIDIWVSMLIYTSATLGFFALGAGILFRVGIVPESARLIQTLSVMYEPFLGAWAPPIYLLGAFCVLYSTFFVANASHARAFTDGLALLRVVGDDAASQRRCIRLLSGLFPLLCLLVYWILPEPAWLVLLSGSAQAVMLPMVGAAALYFRHARSVPELRGGRWFDVGLWGSVALMAVIGVSSLVLEVARFGGR